MIPSNIMVFHGIPSHSRQYHRVPSNTMQYHTLSSNTIFSQCSAHGATSIYSYDGVFFNLHFLGFLCVHFDSSSFAFPTGSDVALNCKGKKKAQDLSKSINNASAASHSQDFRCNFCQKYTLLTHTSHHTKVKKIENTFLITFQIPLLSIGIIMYKLQHYGLHVASDATIFKATLRSFSADCC